MNETPPVATPQKMPGIIIWSCVLGAIVLIAIVLPNFMKVRNTPSAASCVNHMRQIDNGIQQWASESGKTNSDFVDIEAIRSYIKGGVIPTCPQGGTYTIGATVGANPSVTCSYQGHGLPW